MKLFLLGDGALEEALRGLRGFEVRRSFRIEDVLSTADFRNPELVLVAFEELTKSLDACRIIRGTLPLARIYVRARPELSIEFLRAGADLIFSEVREILPELKGLAERKIRVLIVESSAHFSKALARILSADPELEVVGRAHSADEALNLLASLDPDVVLLSIRMPGIGSLDILSEIMELNPKPVILLGEETELDERNIIAGFDYGAFDFLSRPEDPERLPEVRDELLALVKMASSIEVRKILASLRRMKALGIEKKTSKKVVVIGASSGGPQAVQAVLAQLPPNFPAPIVVVQHMPSGFTRAFAERLNAICGLEVEEVQGETEIKAGKVYVAPGGRNLTFEARGERVWAKPQLRPTQLRPNIDVTLRSASKVFGKNVIAVILSGMGSDGCLGARFVRQEGGVVIAQDEKSCVVFGMPKRVIEMGCADFVLSLDEIAKKLLELL